MAAHFSAQCSHVFIMEIKIQCLAQPYPSLSVNCFISLITKHFNTFKKGNDYVGFMLTQIVYLFYTKSLKWKRVSSKAPNISIEIFVSCSIAKVAYMYLCCVH